LRIERIEEVRIMVKLIHPELSYDVRGVLLNVYNSLGPMLKEEYYRDAIVLGTGKRGIVCEAELLKAHLRRLGLKLGLLANFYGTRLVVRLVRIK